MYKRQAEILAARCDTLKLDGPYVQLRPDVHGTDGFFAAVFERRKKAATAAEGEAEALADAEAPLEEGVDTAEAPAAQETLEPVTAEASADASGEADQDKPAS